MQHDRLADCLSAIKNAESSGKEECVAPASSLIKDVLLTIQSHKYIDQFEFVDNGKSGQFRIKLLKSINDCGAIKPRFSVGYRDIEKWEKRYLPAAGYGLLIMTTSNGVIDHVSAKEKMVGGKLVAFIY